MILFKCDKPLLLNFEQLVFQSHGMDNAAVYKKGKTYYFICKYLLFVDLELGYCKFLQKQAFFSAEVYEL